MLGIVALGAGIEGGFLAGLPGAIVYAVTGYGTEGLPTSSVS
ncbi:hypothetical protein [Oceanibium sediminis]|nr:hypothetical protein [Oceanibium sediminis]